MAENDFCLSPLGPVLAVVPAHDEAGRVGHVVQALRALGLPVLVVDDGSTDGTGAEAEAAGAAVLHLHPNRGKGAALKAGFAEALGVGRGPVQAPARQSLPLGSPSPRWAAFLTLDGDGQHDPREAPLFLDEWRRTGADLVVGARDYRQMPRTRWFTNSVSRLLFSWAVGRPAPDNQSGYRLHSRRLAEASLASSEEGFAFEVEEIAICVGRGWGLAWVPIATIYGEEKSDIRPWSHFAGFVRVSMRARRRVSQERRLRGQGR